MSSSPGSWDLTRNLLMGPGRFIIVYAIVVLSPLILVRLLGLKSRGGQFDIAVGSGLVAYMILITAFFFSGRFEWLNGKRGMDLMLKFHRRIVLFAVLLLVIHIVLVAPYSMPDLIWPVFTGLLLLFLLIGIAKTRLKTKMSYERWRLSHGLIALTVLGLSGFHALSEGSYSEHPIVSSYLVFFTLAAVLSLPFVHVYLPFRAAKSPYKITQVKQESSQQWTLEIEPVNGEAMDFLPGQFAFVAFDAPRKPQFHPYSFSSAPSNRPRIAFAIKETGDLTKTIGRLKKGAKVLLDGPYGYMTRDVHRGPKNRGAGLVLLAGGIGITPMISMLREMKAVNDLDSVKLFYGCRHEQDFLFREELESMKTDLNLELHLLLSQPGKDWSGETGRLDNEYLKQRISFADYEHYLYFVCGTSGFVKDIVRSLDAIKGIPFFNVRYEDFSVYN